MVSPSETPTTFPENSSAGVSETHETTTTTAGQQRGASMELHRMMDYGKDFWLTGRVTLVSNLSSSRWPARDERARPGHEGPSVRTFAWAGFFRFWESLPWDRSTQGRGCQTWFLVFAGGGRHAGRGCPTWFLRHRGIGFRFPVFATFPVVILGHGHTIAGQGQKTDRHCEFHSSRRTSSTASSPWPYEDSLRALATEGVGREAWSVISLRSAKSRVGRQIVGWWHRPQVR